MEKIKGFGWVIILTLFAVPSWAQIMISGKVTDASTGEELIGANVYERANPSAGTITDFEGNFILEMPSSSTLIISFIGYNEVEIALDERTYYEVQMTSGEVLDELVVVGYGEVKREDLTGAVETVSTESFNRGAITSPAELLAGKVAGVNISTDGDPGGGSTITVRGLSTLSGGNSPLIVIDGVPLESKGDNPGRDKFYAGSRNPLNLLNPNDIETFTVLKDASAAAIYGNRASGGVILITTKKGKSGQKLSVGYQGNVSFGHRTRSVDVLGAETYRGIIYERYDSNHIARTLLGTSNTDWQDEIYQTGVGTDQNLNFGGAIGFLPYRLSLGYTNKDGILKTDNFKKYSVNLNLNPKFFDNHLQVNFGFKSGWMRNKFADRGAIGNAISMDPTQEVHTDSDDYFGYYTWLDPSGNGLPNALAPTNPLALLELTDDRSRVNNYILNGSIDYRLHFAPDFRINLALGRDHAKTDGEKIIPNGASFTKQQSGFMSEYGAERTNSLLETYLNYKHQFGLHGVDLMFGYSWQHFDESSNSTDIDISETKYNVSAQEYYLISLYSRLNYSFNDKFLLTATIRQDNTSKYAKKYRKGYFPSFSGAYKFIENETSTFNDLKLRIGWGLTGNQNGADFYGYLPRYQYGTPNASYPFGDEYIITLRPNGYVANIKWEETSTLNFGLDVSVIKDRLFASLDVYQRKTKDMLNYVPLPALSNLTNFATTNIGDMKGNGVELALNTTPVVNENVRWDFSFNMAYNRSEITKLTQSNDPNYIGVEVGDIAGGVGSKIQIHSVGHQPFEFFVYEQMYDEEGNILPGEFVDQNEDGVINTDDKIRDHSSLPKVTLGLSSALNWKNLDFSFAGRANFGQYTYNNVQTNIGYLNRLYGSTQYLANITKEAINNNVDDQGDLTFSSHFVEKSNFFRMDHITLGYSFPNVAKGMRLYGTVQNAFVITNYSGIDPEVAIDNNVYPRPRTFVLGASINL